ncbi:DUF2252 domain-containing protein [Amycolatopsis sp. Hca4]|uniref:DUF2252 domain-containing protein n=1 Tax=Amycolatopsis sp. Hca4 TaxID=2742131 RepID=UPI001590F4A2|nr:DUF2252 domain-containing protein [Amycolatopsis sp. Hca4]QKV73437.1 DUF2252 domain-containing protein [Amycolatopsis sp. Hca4]
MTLTENETAAPDVRIAKARTARTAVPAEAHAEFPSPVQRADPLTLLARQDRDRVPELRPLRYGRMAASPLAYFRGAALPAAADLALTPRTGFGVQACGDAQLANFGLFTAQGRRLVFDFADFGETLPAPWEWDVKRLAASFEVTGRENGHAAAVRRRTVLAAVEAYRLAMHDFARRTALDIFFAPADARTLRTVAAHRLGPRNGRAAGVRRFTEIRDGHLRLAERPPSVVPAGHLAGDGDPATLTDRLGVVLTHYRRTLGPARRALLDRYRLADAARTVTGPGDVGTRSWVVLLVRTGTGDPLFLQVQEARPSVLQEYTGTTVAGGPARRVVTGQRRIQATGDVFLGWARAGLDGRTADFHVRRLRDEQPAADVTTMGPDVLRAHARLCGWTLARAHARTGDALAIAAYLGSGPAFAEAVRQFATACADQNERDHAALRQAIRAGHVTATAAP